jgi:hypothetical protein
MYQPLMVLVFTQASRDFHMAENETLPLRSNMNGATAHVKAEESGWLLDRGAPPLDGQVVCCVAAAVLVSSWRVH